MKKKKLIIIIAASVLALAILACAAIAAAAMATPAVYDNTFVGGLGEKFERLNTVEGRKIVIVGGSSAAFGLDSTLIEKYTGMPVVNFGLYAALGTKLMMDLSRANIGPGDVVVLAPEMDAQTMSLYFNPDATLMAMDGNFGMLTHLRGGNLFSLLGAMPRFAGEKIGYLTSGEKPTGSGAYDSSYFNEQGDLTYPRPENVMGMYYDPNTMIHLSADMPAPEFIAYINEYVQFCRSQGAEIYFGFCPMNEMALAEGTTPESIAAFEDHLKTVLGCSLLGTASDHIFSAEFFFDSNFHLNDAGVKHHTVTLVKELLLAIGIPAFVNEELPAAPALPEKSIRYFGDADENAQYFTFELTEFGQRITGLTEAGKVQKTLTMPVAYDGYRVALLGEGALKDGTCEKLIIPAGFEQFITETTSSMMTLENGSFIGASSLKELWIYNRHEATVMPPASFEGVSKDFVVHVPDGSSYGEGYFWGERKLNGINLIFIQDITMN
ncbi:MAG: hypothetical protein E7632_13410 [Ruminococcaceae bacterium]|nr:hypothetical protein [Oscillospiraceae bacterium]